MKEIIRYGLLLRNILRSVMLFSDTVSFVNLFGRSEWFEPICQKMGLKGFPKGLWMSFPKGLQTTFRYPEILPSDKILTR